MSTASQQHLLLRETYLYVLRSLVVESAVKTTYNECVLRIKVNEKAFKILVLLDVTQL